MPEVPRWLEDLMNLFDLDVVERAEWIRHWEEHNSWRRLNERGMRFLHQKGYLSPSQIEDAIRIQRETKEPDLGRILVSLGLVGEREVLLAKAMEMGIGFVDLDRVNVDATATDLLSRELVTHHCVIPVKKDGCTVWLAMSDPRDINALDAVKQATECRIIPTLALQSAIHRAIDRYYPIGG